MMSFAQRLQQPRVVVAPGVYASLAAHGANAPFGGRMFDFTALNGLIGTPQMLASAQSYEEGAA